MPIDLARAVGADLEPTTYTWSEEDVILYNLGVGAGAPPDDPGELKYAYESELVAVPSFATIPTFEMVMAMGSVDGIDVSLSQILHGDQSLAVHAPIPTSGSVAQSGRVKAIYDKGKGALIVIEVVSTLESTGEPIFTNTSGIFVRGEGGFGGETGPAARHRPPERSADHVATSTTLPQQALLYRMASGDKNPLHADPGFAALAGFERPILHGLCTFGIVLKAVIESALGGRPEDVETYEARFTGHVFPGETLVTSIWAEGDRHTVTAGVEGRGTTVLANAVVVRRAR